MRRVLMRTSLILIAPQVARSLSRRRWLGELSVGKAGLGLSLRRRMAPRRRPSRRNRPRRRRDANEIAAIHPRRKETRPTRFARRGVGKDHPLRTIRWIVNEALAAGEFSALYAQLGRPSIPPEKLLRAMLLQAFYSIRSERQLMERL
jgi:hypothetical protein